MVQQKVNSILKDRWYSMPDDEKETWKKWELWDALRFEREKAIFKRENSPGTNTSHAENTGLMDSSQSKLSVPKKRKR